MMNKQKISNIFVLFFIVVFCVGIVPIFGGVIHQLAKKGDYKKIKFMLEGNPGLVDSKDEFGWTPLQIATLMEQYKTVRLLLENGADVNASDRFGLNSIHLAAIKGNSDIFELLGKYGGNANDGAFSIKIPNTIFLITELRPELSEALLALTDNLVKQYKGQKDQRDDTFVYTLMSLKEQLIDINLVRSSGKEEKSRTGNLKLEPETIRRLAEEAKGNISKRREAKAKVDMGDTLLHDAAQKGDLTNVKSLLKTNPKWVNEKNIFGITPLHLAAIGGYREIAESLIEAGAQIDARTGSGITPLYGAVSGGKVELVRFLISRGAKVNEETVDGAAPLHTAATKEMAALLVRSGASVTARNKYGFTPLHIAAHYGYIDVVDYLLSRGAELESQNNTGWTPLCEAVYNGNKEMVEFLVSKGANVNAQTTIGATPLKIARNLKYDEIALILKAHGAF